VIRPAIDAASEIQFVFDNWRTIEIWSRSAIAIIFSPIAAIVTFVLGFGYLALDRRLARLTPQEKPEHVHVAATGPMADARHQDTAERRLADGREHSRKGMKRVPGMCWVDEHAVHNPDENANSLSAGFFTPLQI
jgi:hypothetical protein